MTRSSAQQIVRSLLETDVDPDDIDPKAYMHAGPFGFTQNDTGSWFVTWMGKPTWWMGNQKSAEFSATHWNEQHKVIPFENRLESPFNWYMRTKYGKTYPPHSPHYQPARRRRRVREAEDDVDPKDYVQGLGSAKYFDYILRSLNFYPATDGKWDKPIIGKDTLIRLEPEFDHEDGTPTQLYALEVYLGTGFVAGFTLLPSRIRADLAKLEKRLYADVWPEGVKDKAAYVFSGTV